MAPKILVFTGAPLSDSLDWDESNLVDTFCSPIAQFLERAQAEDRSFIPPTNETLLDKPSWRSIALERGHLTTGLSQSHTADQDHQGAAFFAASDIDSFIEEPSQRPSSESQVSVGSIGQVVSQFYEQSYATHEDIPSSQVAITADSGSSFYSTESSSYGSSIEPPKPKDIPNASPLTNLKEIPDATYLDSIYPQTMTVNLIVGIISIPPPRSIRTRRGANVELIEALVGDETKSGFSINFWLSSVQSTEGDLRSVSRTLRPQDVVLMRNVALSSFRGKVYGQSLRKETTKLHLLYRTKVDRTDVGGYYRAKDLAGETPDPRITKTRRVREWVLRFVGGGPLRTSRGGVDAVREVLPPDTQ